MSESGTAYFLGQAPETIEAVPSQGLTESAIAGMRSNVKSSRIGDSIVLAGSSVEVGRLKRVLESVEIGKSVQVEVAVVETAVSQYETVNRWLDGLRLAVSGELSGDLEATGLPSLTWGFEVAHLLRLREVDKTSRILHNQAIRATAGTKVIFASGRVLADELYQNTAESGRDLRTRIERRTVGWNMEVEASELTSGWYVKATVKDGAVAQAEETTTELTSETRLALGGGWVMLADYCRAADSTIGRDIGRLSRVPVLRRVFRQSQDEGGQRRVIVWIRLVE